MSAGGKISGPMGVVPGVAANGNAYTYTTRPAPVDA